MKLTRILAVLLLGSATMFAQGGQRIGQATQSSGGVVKTIPGALITVCPYNVSLVCSSLASIYSNATLTLPLSNPMYADGDGNYYWYAASGNYLEKTSAPGQVAATIPVTVIGASSASAGGTNGQIQFNNVGILGGFTLSGDGTINTSTGVFTLNTVNSNVGSCGDSTHVCQITLNGKGLATAAAPVSIGGGTVTGFSAGSLTPLFTSSVATATTTPALTFALSNFSADNIFGNFTASPAAPSTQAIPACANDGLHALSYPSHTLTCSTITSGGSGTVTTFSAGALSPLFTSSVATATTTPALTFSLSTFSADNIFGNFTGGTAAPSTQAVPACPNDGAHALVYVSHVLTCETITAGGLGTVTHTSGALTLNAGMFGNGGADSKVDTGITTDGSGDLSAVTVTTPGDGVHPGLVGLIGNTTAPVLPANTVSFSGPNSATFTAYGFQFPTSTPTSGQTFVFGTPVSGVVPVTYGSGGGGAVSSVFTRTGAVVATSGDYTVAQVTGAAPLANPVFTTNVSVGAGNALTETETAGVGGTTANLLVVADTSNPTKYITAPLGAAGVLGVAVSTVLANATVEVTLIGDIDCVADNTVTAGNLIGSGTVTAGRCKDLGTTDSTTVANNIQVVGRAKTGASTGSVTHIEFYGPGNYGAQIVSGTNRNIPVTLGVCQGVCTTGTSGGVSIAGNTMSVATAPTPYALQGSTTLPNRGVPQFVTAGVIGTGTANEWDLTVPSNYTANAALTLHYSFACPSVTTGSVTWGATYADTGPTGASQPTYYSTGYSSGAVTVNGTANNTVAASITVTPNVAGSPTVSAGDLFSFALWKSVDAGSCNPYITQMYWVY